MECKKHNHQSNKGVCPNCLRDKLSRLPNTTSYYIIHRSDLSNQSSATDSSSPSSPAAVVKEHRRAGSMSMSFAVREALIGGGLKKSRSMAHHVTRDYVVRDLKKKKTVTATATAKKIGFWAKLLHLKGKGGGGGGGGGGVDVGGLVTSRQRVY